MHDAPRYDPLEASTFFADGASSRPLVANTVARGQLREDEHLYEGHVDGQLADDVPDAGDGGGDGSAARSASTCSARRATAAPAKATA